MKVLLRVALLGLFAAAGVGLAIGVNLKFWETEEIIFGVNFGRVFGSVGITAGINIIDPFTDGGEETETEVRPYLGVDFRF